MTNKILLIEDDAIVRRSIEMILAKGDFTVTSAENGTKGLAVFRGAPPDLVITDVIMPEKDGIETILEIRRQGAPVKIIAISGGGRAGNAQFLRMAQTLGADEVLKKPFTEDALRTLVDKCLN